MLHSDVIFNYHTPTIICLSQQRTRREWICQRTDVSRRRAVGKRCRILLNGEGDKRGRLLMLNGPKQIEWTDCANFHLCHTPITGTHSFIGSLDLNRMRIMWRSRCTTFLPFPSEANIMANAYLLLVLNRIRGTRPLLQRASDFGQTYIFSVNITGQMSHHCWQFNNNSG